MKLAVYRDKNNEIRNVHEVYGMTEEEIRKSVESFNKSSSRGNVEIMEFAEGCLMEYLFRSSEREIANYRNEIFKAIENYKTKIRKTEDSLCDLTRSFDRLVNLVKNRAVEGKMNI